MELKAFSKKGVLVLTTAVLFGVIAPILFVTQWDIAKYAAPFFLGAIFFLGVNSYFIGNGVGAAPVPTVIGLIVPLSGVPGAQEGLYGWIVRDGNFGPAPVALVLFSLPALITLGMLLKGKKVLAH